MLWSLVDSTTAIDFETVQQTLITAMSHKDVFARHISFFQKLLVLLLCLLFSLPSTGKEVLVGKVTVARVCCVALLDITTHANNITFMLSYARNAHENDLIDLIIRLLIFTKI